MAIASASAIVSTGLHAKMVTPTDAKGPFYPITPQKDKDFDLTQIQGKSGVAKGEIIEISGQVFDTDLNPIEDATIDLWQANSFGKYHHPHDSSDAPVDEYFQGWAIFQSGKDGRFKFKTVMPGAYPLGSSNPRTPHIHLMVSKLGYVELITQMYFPDQPLNDQDGLFKRKSKAQQQAITAKRQGASNRYQYDIVLEKV
ncbi:hypothetical protein WG68_07155 [Arsukibacterium ikkense]|uniref:Intradiol ring-cleavage dioxygenases domain-containing protein n=2 Tax=Arsukibacterium ikkense TaxID=336831 RepID=A0A0M2VAN6_9GAMM|nr:hypothetical protein WG68_07155 [Arsukibacterium ikkense]